MRIFLIDLIFIFITFNTFGQTDLTPIKINTVVYGENCGFAGLPPEFRNKLEEAILEGNINLIKAWLNSDNKVIQAYGVEGCIRTSLHNSDSKIQKRIIEIKSDSSLISTCNGCIYLNQQLKRVVENIILTEK